MRQHKDLVFLSMATSSADLPASRFSIRRLTSSHTGWTLPTDIPTASSTAVSLASPILLAVTSEKLIRKEYTGL